MNGGIRAKPNCATCVCNAPRSNRGYQHSSHAVFALPDYRANGCEARSSGAANLRRHEPDPADPSKSRPGLGDNRRCSRVETEEVSCHLKAFCVLSANRKKASLVSKQKSWPEKSREKIARLYAREARIADVGQPTFSSKVSTRRRRPQCPRRCFFNFFKNISDAIL